MDEYDDGPYWAILLMYGSHYMRHTGFRRLMVFNGTPGFLGCHNILFLNIHKYKNILKKKPVKEAKIDLTTYRISL